MAEFARVGLADRVEFLIVEKHPTDSEQGIYESHIACLRAGLAAGAETILVFEDDVILPGFSKDVLERSVEFMRSDRRWNVFFFGGYVNASRKTETRSVVRVRFRCSLHAYAMHRRLAETLVGRLWAGKAIDVVVREQCGEQAFAAYPAFAFQSNSATDNDKRVVIDQVRRLIGGQRVLQRWNEFSSLHFQKLVWIHVIAVLGMVLFAFMAHRGHWFRHEPLDFLLHPGR
jgi:glycosyl transferase, family 25